jgi:predicted dehydrogenase
MNQVRMAVIGLGHAGSRYADLLAGGKISGGRLAALCSRNLRKAERYPADTKRFVNWADLLHAGVADAVIIATPHAEHVPAGVAALKTGLHVLVEKPLAARLADAERLIAAHHERGEKQVFAVMFNLRFVPAHQAIKQMICTGGLGRIRRVHWTFTDWYRTESYFRSSWRGTWAGEGGGLLINQAIHHIDLLQWWLGKPVAVQTRASWGKYHNIEVEDEAAAWWRYDGDLTVSMVFSTGEAPGFNHLEIVGDLGALMWDGSRLVWHRLAVSLPVHTAECDRTDEKPAWRSESVRLKSLKSSHAAALQNFVNAIRGGEALVAPAIEGLASLEIANAMQLSALTEKEVTLPLDIQSFESVLAQKALSKTRRNP